MLLAIDIGNTNMEFGVFKEEQFITSFRLGTNREITSDEAGLFLSQFFYQNSIQKSMINAVIIASVVPQVMYSVNNAIVKYIGRRPYVVGDNIFCNIENLYDLPSEVGADRLVNAVAAYRKYGGPLIVVDFGTATTFDAISESGAYMGGAIYPGIKIAMEALFQKAAKLPRVELKKPSQMIGTNTVASLQSGVINGYVGAVTNITQHMRREINGSVRIIATGGLARMFDELIDSFDIVDRTLTLDGLRMIYDDYLGTLIQTR